MGQVARVFQNGRSLAMRLPAEFRFESIEVNVRCDPVTSEVILSRRPPYWEAFFQS
jgi:antitoxin VapB